MNSEVPSIEIARERARRLAYALVRDADIADDVAQEAALRISQGRFRPRTSFAAAMRGMVRNIVWNHRRSEKRREAKERRGVLRGEASSPPDLLVRAESQVLLWSRVRALPEPYRVTLLMRYLDDLPPRRIAASLGLSVETVKSRLKRGLAMLRTFMDEQHDGRRDTWMVSLFPLAQPQAPIPYALLRGAKHVGAVAMKLTAIQRTAVVAMVLLVAGAAGAIAFGVFDSHGGEPPTESPISVAVPDTVSPDAPHLTSTATKKHDGDSRRLTETTNEAASKEAAHKPVRDPYLVPSIVRRSPFGLPRRASADRKAKNANGDWVKVEGFGGGGMTGHHTSYPVGLLRPGKGRLRVAVVDQDKTPVPGANVWFGPTQLTGIEGISYGDLKKMGKTNVDGILLLESLPEGSVGVGADFNNRLSGRRGFDGRSMVAVTIESIAQHTATVRLPYSVAKSGTVRGRIVDEFGAPVSSAQVFIRRNFKWSKRDGTFALEGVPAGEHVLKIREWAHKPVDRAVTVSAGGVVDVEITVKPDDAGGVVLQGTVVGPTGELVPGAFVTLGIESDHATLRSVRADPQGRFVMRNLPERVKKEACKLQSFGLPRYGGVTVNYPDGLDQFDVRLVIKPRYVNVRFHVLDQDTEKPVRYAVVRAVLASAKNPAGFWRQADGSYKGTAEAGPAIRVEVMALDHENTTFELDVPSTEDTYEHTVKLNRVRPDSEEVALEVRVRHAFDDTPIAQLTISVHDPSTGERISSFDGTRSHGLVRMPMWTGRYTLTVESKGFERIKQPLFIPAGEVQAKKVISLRPNP